MRTFLIFHYNFWFNPVAELAVSKTALAERNNTEDVGTKIQ